MIDIAVHVAEIGSVRPALVPEEQRQAEAMPAAAARAFVAGRSLLRHLVGRLLDEDPQALVLRERAGGKPVLQHRAKVAFSVAHGGTLAVVAISRETEVGVDVEPISARRRVEDIAAAAFGEDALAALLARPLVERAREFTRWWVRAEATCKATGRGLVIPLEPEPPAGFSVEHVAVPGEHVAAVAWTGGPARITACTVAGAP